MATAKQVSLERLEILAHVAELYFVQGLNQAQIAQRTSYSRSMISRLLSEARDRGVVEIRIHHPLRRAAALEQTFQSRFGLKQVRIVEVSPTTNDAQARVGMLAAQVVSECVQDDDIVGVAWGSTLSTVASALRTQLRRGVRVVQMLGSVGTRTPELDGVDIARRIARAFGATYLTLPAPLLTSDERTSEALLRDERIREVLALARRARIALVGIGAVDPAHSALVQSGFLKPSQAVETRKAGAVGDVCAIPFDIDGRLLDLPWTRRRVGIDPSSLMRIPLRIGIAQGEVKAQAILGALRSRLINALVTDDLTAAAILRESA